MTRVLTDTAVELLGTLPPYYRQDPLAQAVMQGIGGRVDELFALAEELRLRFTLPQNADDDEWGSLSYWERLMGLPVAPAGVTEARRLEVLLAHYRKREARTGAGWVALLTLLLGTTLWDYEEGPIPGHITITISDPTTSYAANVVALLARAITPAGYVINFAYTDGFLVGFSSIGSASPLL